MTARRDIFTEISNDAGSRIRSRDWYMAKINELKGLATKNKLLKYDNLMTTKLEIGSIYLFNYSPKAKSTLPYYDTFPLVIPFSSHGDLFTGFNLHYLPPAIRWTLLKALLKNQDNASIRRLNVKTKMKMDYATLKESTHIPLLKPTIHSYLLNHIVPMSKGMFLKIPPADWHMSVLLPVQSFKSQTGKANTKDIWKQSMGMK